MAFRPQKLVTHYLYTVRVTIVFFHVTWTMWPDESSKRSFMFESHDKHSITDESSVMTSFW